MEETLKESFDLIIEQNKRSALVWSADTYKFCYGIMQAAYNMALPQWVPISERLPECNKRVLCYVLEDGELYSIFDSTYKGMNIFTSDGEYLTFVTHWMPLPPNPSKD